MKWEVVNPEVPISNTMRARMVFDGHNPCIEIYCKADDKWHTVAWIRNDGALEVTSISDKLKTAGIPTGSGNLWQVIK